MLLSSHLSSGKLLNSGKQTTLFSFPTPPLSFPANHHRRRENAYNNNPIKQHSRLCVRASWPNGLEIASVVTGTSKHVKVKGTVTVKVTIGGFLAHLHWTSPLDGITDLLGKTLLLELVSSELDSETQTEKERVKAYAHRASQQDGEVKYECEFTVPAKFGDIGAVAVENEHHAEMFVSGIVLEGLPSGPVSFACNSWVQPKPVKRVFFSNKSYLPSETPEGLKRLRQEELEVLRGTGEGERKKFDRIYDYDVYNDLGDPDDNPSHLRPVLGGPQHPYPRRCRTGRPHCKNDPLSEQRIGDVYVPRDEAFSEVKQLTFSGNTVRSVLHAVIPSLETALLDPKLGFPHFSAIDSLYDVGVNLPKPVGGGILKTVIPRLIKAVSDAGDALLQFEPPEMIDRDKFSWFRDEEFARQMLAGLNPYSIELVSEWPLRSNLESEIYGPPESLITKEIVEEQIRGVVTFEEALKEKRLFMLDYHDLYLPYVNKVRELEDRVFYASRTLLFRNNDNTLRLLAIELTRPPCGEKPQWKQVFTPSYHNTGSWLWKLAKAHVAASDAGYHQLVIHWLRTHCCTEPYIIAANRQLSAMHPVYRLLHPHFRYTMEINALARQSLINADGIIESTFSPGKYSIELSSVAYDKLWRFDMEALPADLIRRGMAVEDPSAKHGLKLTIEDYPFADDGLILWDAIKEWVGNYVNHYYPEAATVQSDTELQTWWTEVRTKGHADKKDEPWWPVLNTQEDLIHVLSTIIWVTSGHHSAVNFGQYPFGGYFPNRPTITRCKMPTEDLKEEEFKNFLLKPEAALLKAFPSQIQATTVMAVLNILSSHSPDEEYIGEKAELSWSENPVIHAAFERFNARLKELEATIDERNTNLNLKNRTGAGVVPYQLLKPFSDAGVTGKGVPNSISI